MYDKATIERIIEEGILWVVDTRGATKTEVADQQKVGKEISLALIGNSLCLFEFGLCLPIKGMPLLGLRKIGLYWL